MVRCPRRGASSRSAAWGRRARVGVARLRRWSSARGTVPRGSRAAATASAAACTARRRARPPVAPAATDSQAAGDAGVAGRVVESILIAHTRVCATVGAACGITLTAVRGASDLCASRAVAVCAVWNALSWFPAKARQAALTRRTRGWRRRRRRRGLQLCSAHTMYSSSAAQVIMNNHDAHSQTA
jgi:hypothetical protein